MKKVSLLLDTTTALVTVTRAENYTRYWNLLLNSVWSKFSYITVLNSFMLRKTSKHLLPKNFNPSQRSTLIDIKDLEGYLLVFPLRET